MKRSIFFTALLIMVLMVAIFAPKPEPAKAFVFYSWTTGTISSDNVTTSEINLGSDSDRMNIELPTVNSTNVTIYVARQVGGTYRQLGSSGVTISSTTGNIITIVDLGGFEYVKLLFSAQQTAGTVINVRGYSY